MQPNNILFDIIYRPVENETNEINVTELFEITIKGKNEVVWPRAYQKLSDGQDKMPLGLLLCFIPR